MLIVDSKSIQNADTSGRKGYDAGKKKAVLNFILAYDILGLPHMLSITSANITDRNGAIEMLSYYSTKSDRLIRLQKILVDGAYSGEEFADAVWAICDAEVEVAKRNELHKFAVIPK